MSLWPRFSVRLLLLITTLIAAVLGWRTAVDKYNHALRRGSHNQERYELDYAIYVLRSVKNATYGFTGYDGAIKAFQDRRKVLDELDESE